MKEERITMLKVFLGGQRVFTFVLTGDGKGLVKRRGALQLATWQ